MVCFDTRSDLTQKWTDSSNCYAYALRRNDIGWVNPGWIGKSVCSPQTVKMKDIFALYAAGAPECRQKQNYISLLVKDGCNYLGHTLPNEMPEQRIMFVALSRQGNIYDYHCIRYDGIAGWSGKNNVGIPKYYGQMNDAELKDQACREGFLHVLGYFTVPDLPENISLRSYKKLAVLKHRTDRQYHDIQKQQMHFAPLGR